MIPSGSEKSSDLDPQALLISLLIFFAGGAIGGVLGIVALLFYRLFTNPYLLGGGLFTTVTVLAAFNGLLVGGIILSICLLLRRNVGILLRVLVGTLFSFCSATIYLYVHGALLYSDFRAFISNSLLVGLFLGAPAGALAMGRLQIYRFSRPTS